MRTDRSRRWLIPILAVYALLAGLYAVYTPPWQAPDEPAHFNFVRYLVRERRLPELRPGDYPVEYLEEIKSRRFPPEMSVEGIRYQSHQPPLYYILSVPSYALGRALGLETPLLPLRLFTVVLGVASVAAAWALVRQALPDRRDLAMGAAAFMATLPMYVAMTGVVNNDVLATLVLTLVVWQLLLARQQGWSTGRVVGLGVLMGLALLTKMQAYVAVGLVALGWAWHAWETRGESRALGRPVRQALLMGAVALALVLPWLVRNVTVYGLADPLAMARHNQVVVGQLTTADLLAEIGVVAFARRFAQTTFQSFWGQFGWMGVVLPTRVYQALGALTGLAVLGVADAMLAWRSAWRDKSVRYALALLGAWLALTVAGYLWYNLRFVQHQGRYLFPAIVPLGLLFTAGVQRLVQSRPWWVLGLLAGVALALLARGMIVGHVPRFTMLLLGGGMVGIDVGHEVERRVPGLPLAAIYLAMAGLALWSLRFMVPLLTP